MIFKNKKADLDVSMSWIFMLIIGGIFFLLAYNIVDNYKENEDIKYEYELKQSLRSVLNLAGRTTGVEENKIENAKNLFQGKSAEVKCLADKPTLWLDDGKISDTQNQFLNNYPIFMHKMSASKTDDVYVAVENFKMPFKITNMVAITTNRNLIIMDKDSNITKKLSYKFNKGSYRDLNYKTEFDIQTQLSTISTDAKKKNLDSIVLISDVPSSGIPNFLSSTDLNSFDNYKDRVYQVQVNENQDGKSGTIYMESPTTTSSYVSFNYIDYDNSLSFVTMSLFSNSETFNCSYNQIMKSIPNVYDFYIQKTTYLHNYAKDKLICSASQISYTSDGKYNGIRQQENYKNLNDSLVSIKAISWSDGIDNSDLTNLNQNLNELDTKFKILEGYNCPYVY